MAQWARPHLLDLELLPLGNLSLLGRGITHFDVSHGGGSVRFGGFLDV